MMIEKYLSRPSSVVLVSDLRDSNSAFPKVSQSHVALPLLRMSCEPFGQNQRWNTQTKPVVMVWRIYGIYEVSERGLLPTAGDRSKMDLQNQPQ